MKTKTIKGIMTLLTAVILVGAFALSFTACDNGTKDPCASGHAWGEYTQTTLPTCTTAGIKTRACTRSGCSAVDPVTETGDVALGHDFEITETTTAPTCTATGLGSGYCKRNGCTETITNGVLPIDPTAHNFQFTSTIAPTCTVGGYDLYTCTHNSLHTEQRNPTAVDQTAHNFVFTSTVAPTCTTGGYDLYTCSHNSAHTEQRNSTAIDSTNHTGKGEKNGTIVPATCAVTGTKQILCNGCNAELRVDTLEVDPTAHSFVTYIPNNNATCTADGTKTANCNHSCGATDIIIDEGTVLGHDHTESLICNRINCDHQYSVGDTGPGGGKIYYVADGQNGRSLGLTVEGYGNEGDKGYFATYIAHYLEAAPASPSGSDIKWCNCSYLPEDGCYVSGVPNLTYVDDDIGWGTPNQNTLDTIGQGRRDTMFIIAYHTTDTASNNAAMACDEYTNNGMNDWFLPSIGELFLYNQGAVTEQKPTGFVWSSSQFNNKSSWYLNFNLIISISSRLYTGKSSITGGVRAIRAF